MKYSKSIGEFHVKLKKLIFFYFFFLLWYISPHFKVGIKIIKNYFSAVTMNETVIVIASQKVNVTRGASSATERMTSERGNIVVQFKNLTETKYDAK